MNILEYENYQEIKSHGDISFPYITYPCTIPLDFPCVPLHWHDDMEIIYVKKGQGIISVDLTEYFVEKGSLIFILPGQLHSIEQKDSFSMEYENIIFNTNILLSRQADACASDYFIPLFNRRIEIPVLITPDNPHYENITSCIDLIDSICQYRRPPAYQFFIKSQLFQLFFILFTNYGKEISSEKNKKSLDKIKTVLKYIENNYADSISISQIANVCSLSPSHFMKFFKSVMGTTFTEYLNSYRLTMASRMLLSSSSSVLSISSECGFENLSYFNRLFKKKFGMAPTIYRKHNSVLSLTE